MIHWLDIHFEGGHEILEYSCICLTFLHCVLRGSKCSYFEGGNVSDGCAALSISALWGVGSPTHTRVNGTKDPSQLCMLFNSDKYIEQFGRTIAI